MERILKILKAPAQFSLWFLMALAGTLLFCADTRAERVGGGGGKGKWSGVMYGGFTFPNPRFQNSGGLVEGFPGVSWGFGLETRVLPTVGIKIDILYCNKGYEVISDVHTRYPTAFVSFPVQIVFQPTPFFAVHGGPYLSSLIVTAEQQAQGVESPAKGKFTNDYGLTIGFWLGFRANNTLMIGLDTRYDLGLADIEHDAWPEDKLFSRTILSMMTFNFTF